MSDFVREKQPKSKYYAFTREEKMRLIEFVKKNKCLHPGARAPTQVQTELWKQLSVGLGKTGTRRLNANNIM